MVVHDLTKGGTFQSQDCTEICYHTNWQHCWCWRLQWFRRTSRHELCLAWTF